MHPPSAWRQSQAANILPPDFAYLMRCTAQGAFHHLDCIIDGESVWLLNDREVFEGLCKLLGDRHRAIEDVGVIEEPLVVRVRSDIGELIRVGAQVKELRQP